MRWRTPLKHVDGLLAGPDRAAVRHRDVGEEQAGDDLVALVGELEARGLVRRLP